MGSVFVRDAALLSMIISSLEVYRKECFGILLGRRKGKNYWVSQAINFQSATRHYDFVSIDKLRENRIGHTLKFLTTDRFLGDFHSHAGNYEKLSKGDLEDMQQSGPKRVFFLVVVKNAKRPFRWIYNAREKSLSGTIAKKFFVKLFAFEVNAKTKKVDKLVIRSDLPKKFNALAKEYGRLEKTLKKIEKETAKHSTVKEKLKQRLKAFN